MEKRYYFSLVQTELHLILLFNYYPFFLLFLLSNSEIQTTGQLSSFFFLRQGLLYLRLALDYRCILPQLVYMVLEIKPRP